MNRRWPRERFLKRSTEPSNQRDDKILAGPLALGSEVTDASVSLVGAVSGFDPDPTETTVTRFVDRSVVQAVLVSEFVCDFGIRGIESVKRCRLIQATASSRCELRQVLLTSIQHSQTLRAGRLREAG